MTASLRTLTAVCLLVLFGTACTPDASSAQDPPKQEFRGAWIASVASLDWPSTPGAPPSLQQRELRLMIEDLADAGINAVIFQVRPECDALYDSPLEPWSYWLTGVSGKAPDPYYDPLTYAIDLAHARGMELHAWFNPFRCERDVGRFPLADNHPAAAHPEWMLNIDNEMKLLDPGQPAVRDHAASVIADVVRRYDVDGIHFDDYFYPYPGSPRTVRDSDDQATFDVHHRGFTNRGDWRRDNIDLFVAQVQDSIQALKPHVKFGISPFGIWKNGVPPGIVGLDAYSQIYGDARAWLDAETIDYLAPQLYWAFGGQQDYGRLAPWWASVSNGRHVYPGHIFRSTYSSDEVPRQLRYNRGNDGLQGSVLFRAKNITSNTQGIVGTLQNDIYRYPALTPTMAYKDLTAPGTPPGFRIGQWDGDVVTLRWDRPAGGDFQAEARRFAVYRMRSASTPDWQEVTQDPANLMVVTGDTTFTDDPGESSDLYYYVVTAVSANGIESPVSDQVVLQGRAVAVETETPSMSFALEPTFPNPFQGTAEIAYRLERAATVHLRVFDALGREVATLLDGAVRGVGRHALQWNATDAAGRALSSGTYFVMLEVDGHRTSQPMALVR